MNSIQTLFGSLPGEYMNPTTGQDIDDIDEESGIYTRWKWIMGIIHVYLGSSKFVVARNKFGHNLPSGVVNEITARLYRKLLFCLASLLELICSR